MDDSAEAIEPFELVCTDDLEAFAAEDGVEAGAELAVAIVDEAAELRRPVGQ